MLLFAVGEGVRDRILASDNISLNANLAKYREPLKQGGCEKTGTRALAIIALMVFAWLWRIISCMLIGTLVLTTSLLSVLIALIIQIVLPIAVIVFAVKLFTKKK